MAGDTMWVRSSCFATTKVFRRELHAAISLLGRSLSVILLFLATETSDLKSLDTMPSERMPPQNPIMAHA